MGSDLKEILGLTSQELCGYLAEHGEPPFHGRQIYRAVYVHRKSRFDEITELPKPLRARLSKQAQVTFPSLRTMQHSVDGTEKYLLELSDHRVIEAVWIPEERRVTLCISTQVGCAMDCQFCLTALMGFSRNLSAGEIIGQVLYILRDHERRGSHGSSHQKPINIVLMGMGEPLHNFSEVVRALILMTDPKGLSLPRHRITLSTVGLVPRILELAKAPVVPNLAVSLSATTDEVRDRLVPINRKYPIRELLDACAQFPLGSKQYLTFEYVLIDSTNDSDQDARRLVKLLARLRAKVNLLPLNPGNSHGLKPSPPERALRFQGILTSKSLPAFVRRPRGIDIAAACGQLHHLQKNLKEPIKLSRGIISDFDEVIE